jgi:hypothetical protein
LQSSGTDHGRCQIEVPLVKANIDAWLREADRPGGLKASANHEDDDLP